MTQSKPVCGWKDKILFTPGPLTTSRTVKQAMLQDLGSRDYIFINMIRDIRDRLLVLGQVKKGDYDKACLFFRQTLGKDAEFNGPFYRMAQYALLNGEQEKAKSYLMRVV